MIKSRVSFQKMKLNKILIKCGNLPNLEDQDTYFWYAVRQTDLQIGQRICEETVSSVAANLGKQCL